jgi:hypothetical protein
MAESVCVGVCGGGWVFDVIYYLQEISPSDRRAQLDNYRDRINHKAEPLDEHHL